MSDAPFKPWMRVVRSVVLVLRTQREPPSADGGAAAEYNVMLNSTGGSYAIATSATHPSGS